MGTQNLEYPLIEGTLKTWEVIMKVYVGNCSCGDKKATAFFGKFLVWWSKHASLGHKVERKEEWSEATSDEQVQQIYRAKTK